MNGEIIGLRAERDAALARVKELEDDTKTLRADNARLRGVLMDLLGKGHVLKCFANTVLRWHEQPGVKFETETRLIVKAAEENHALIVAALAESEELP